MNIDQIVDLLLAQDRSENTIAWHRFIEPKDPVYADIPEFVPERLANFLKDEGVMKLYSHQREALELYQQSKNFIITTPTASGKTMAYLLPILIDKMLHPEGRHLLMFPTKALAQDQLALFRSWSQKMGLNWNISTFDGDTPPEIRRSVKKAGDLILTNPDMLHTGILPHHTTWKNLFQNLRSIVIDETHMYLGVFGSHVANVFRRLNRILRHYGSAPRYYLSSATIANPVELAEALTEQSFSLISKSGAPEGGRHILFYNPPVIDEMGTRASAYRHAAGIGSQLLNNAIPSIFFARSRNRTEMLLTMLQEQTRFPHRQKIRGYRGGYLPNERRNIEKGLREGNILGVVSTNALELGIDIGSLRAVVSVGYPGRISSLTQQFGRAGRKKETSLAVMVATASALDQYLMKHPEFFYESPGEAAIIHPDNQAILLDHLKCAAYEYIFDEDDTYGSAPVKDVLDYFADERILLKKNHKYFWMNQVYPAAEISLRSAAQDNFVIVDKSQTAREKVIGEVDYFSAPTMIHEEAIYQHQGRHYYVEALLWEQRRAEVKEIRSDYFTEASTNVDLSVLVVDKKHDIDHIPFYFGEVTVTSKTQLYKKIKIKTNENLGWGQIQTPEITMHTQGSWFSLPESLFPPKSKMFHSDILQRLSYVLHQMSPLVALCDIRDVRVESLFQDQKFGDRSVVFYDQYPGGVGLSFKLVRNLESLLLLGEKAITDCECNEGCPACIGVWDASPPDEAPVEIMDAYASAPFKKYTSELIENLLTALKKSTPKAEVSL